MKIRIAHSAMALIELLFVLQVSKAQASRTLIHGGTEVPTKRYPYLAALFYKYETGELLLSCGGSLIAPNVILTAAHCSDSIDIAYLGVHNYTRVTEEEGEIYEIYSEQKVIYPLYNNSTMDGDYLLLFLDTPSKFDPVALNSNPDVPMEDALLTTIGWGMQETGNTSVVPKEAIVEERSNFWCKVAYAATSDADITENMICAEGGSSFDACQGDSGGPLIVRGEDASNDVLVGVVSWGFGCAEIVSVVYPGVYARVSSVKLWIEDQIEIKAQNNNQS
jgi:trypsin